MIDEIYKNSFKEVYDILKNTDQELLDKIPTKFMDFIKDNMNTDYQTNIKTDLEIDKQTLLKETESILSLIYRSYWATDEEKQNFKLKDNEELLKAEELKKSQYKDIDEIFQKRKSLNNVTLDNNLMVIKKENFIEKIFNKILSIFRK